jgi:hypothetical protein
MQYGCLGGFMHKMMYFPPLGEAWLRCDCPGPQRGEQCYELDRSAARFLSVKAIEHL